MLQANCTQAESVIGEIQNLNFQLTKLKVKTFQVCVCIADSLLHEVCCSFKVYFIWSEWFDMCKLI